MNTINQIAEFYAGSHLGLATMNVVLAALLAIFVWRYLHLSNQLKVDAQAQRDLVENLSEGVYRGLPNGTLINVNKALVELSGYRTEAQMLAAGVGLDDQWYVEPKRRNEFREILLRDGVVRDFISEVYRHKTGERIWISESARLVFDKKSGKPRFYEGSIREITETVKKLQAEKLLHKLSDQVPGGLFQFSRAAGGKLTINYLSAGFRSITGFNGEEGDFDPMFFANLAHPADRLAFLQSFRDSGSNREPWDVEFRTSAELGAERWLRVTAQPEAIEGKIVWYGYIADISVRKASEMEIQKLAFYDPLTRLPNRRMFIDRMSQCVSNCQKRRRASALIFIDLDNFKTLNDTRGHDVGDAYLVQVAERLADCVQAEDMVARIGGDEFVIVIERAGKDKANASRTAIMTANKALSAMRADFELGHFSHRSSASLGVVVFDGEDQNPDEILKHADIAMYQAKAAGRNGMALYDHQSMSAESDRYRLLEDLKRALAEDKIELFYQPQMDDSGQLVGAEALCRWDHPEHGLLLPDAFVPLTQQFGLGQEFCDLVLRKSVTQLGKWQRSPETRGLRLAVNVSARSFSSEEFVPRLSSLIHMSGVDAPLLTLEVTENVMAKDRALIARRMRELKELGVRLSLDDFGAGYSSLAHLKRLPFDELKIDGSFIADIEKSESDRALVRSILGTARTLRLTAVAENVENPRQEQFLRAFGCDYFQGWFYSPALPPEGFIAFARAHRAKCDAESAEQLRA